MRYYISLTKLNHAHHNLLQRIQFSNNKNFLMVNFLVEIPIWFSRTKEIPIWLVDFALPF